MASLCQRCGAELATWTGSCPKCGGVMQLEVKDPQDPMLGKIVGGRYQVLKKLGQGGMGAVYLAEHQGVGQRVAIKFLNASFSSDRNVLQRFLNEARSYGQIAHPHAVQLHDFGQDDAGNLYISMEYIEGQDLKRLLEKEGRLSLRDATDIVLQVCDVLAYAHAKGIVHRDLKPENIMLVKSLRGWHAKVLDFGVARLMAEQTRVTAAGSICGTPSYMSPEQASGGDVDHRADVYALGLVLFECLTGVHPFIAATIHETLRRQVKEPLPHLANAAPDVKFPDALDAALQKATSKAREERFNSLTDFAKALVAATPTSIFDPHAGPEGVVRLEAEVREPQEKSSHADTPYERPGASSKVLVAASIGAAVLLAGAGIWYFARRPPPVPAGWNELEAPERSVRASPLQAPASSSEPPKAMTTKIKPPEPTSPAAGSAKASDPAPGSVAPTSTAKRPVAAVERPERPSKTELGAATAEIQRVGDLSVLNLAHAEFDAGRLETSAQALKRIPARSTVRADALALQKEINALTEMVNRADALYRQGKCEDAVRVYEQVRRRNAGIAKASEGIARCKREMPSGVLE